ncbi:MAG: heme exporter protein CcmD [Polaromonas sp.]
MIWESWSDFFAMGGYALYVWGSLVVVFSLMLCEVFVLTLRGKSSRKELARASDAAFTGGRT